MSTTNLTIKENNIQEIEVDLHFLKTNEGGRATPVKSGYRTQFHFISGDDWTIQLQFENEEWVVPGGTVKAHGIFLCQEPLKMIHKNMRFELREGIKKIAEGEIL